MKLIKHPIFTTSITCLNLFSSKRELPFSQPREAAGHPCGGRAEVIPFEDPALSGLSLFLSRSVDAAEAYDTVSAAGLGHQMNLNVNNLEDTMLSKCLVIGRK